MEAISKARITFSEKVTDNIIEKLKQQVAIKDEERKKVILIYIYIWVFIYIYYIYFSKIINVALYLIS